MKRSRYLLALSLPFLLTACSPHPGAGVWKSTAENNDGIKSLVVNYEGQATFISRQSKNLSIESSTWNTANDTNWHCFWAAIAGNEIKLSCKPSTNPEREVAFTLTINELDQAELRHGEQLITVFSRQDENPSPQE